MTVERDPREIDEEFARMLQGEGVRLEPLSAPRELAESERGLPRTFSADEPEDHTESEASARQRARAAHPSAGAGTVAHPWRGSDRDPEVDDEEILYGDFVAPDPDLPTPSNRSLWGWTGLICGLVVVIASAMSPVVTSGWAWLGAGIAIGSLISLLAQAPRRREGDGAEV